MKPDQRSAEQAQEPRDQQRQTKRSWRVRGPIPKTQVELELEKRVRDVGDRKKLKNSGRVAGVSEMR